jgi:peptide/nickel transport system substrate-binding protein
MPPNGKTVESGKNPVSRRRFLAASGVAGVAGVAGCASGDGGDGGDDGDGGDGSDGGGNDSDGGGGDGGSGDGGGGNGEPVDPVYDAQIWNVAQNYQWNPYNPNLYSGSVGALVFTRFLVHNVAQNQLNGWLIEDWEKSGGELTFTLTDKEFPWHDGNGVLDAQDVATKLKLDAYMQNPIANFSAPDAISHDTDAGTVTIGLEKDFSETVLMWRFTGMRANTPHHVYEEYLQAFEDATTDEETKAAQEKLTGFTLEEPVGSGTFQYESAGQNEMLTTKFPDHPSADGINWPRYRFNYLNSANQGWQALRGDKVDGLHTWFTPGKVYQEYPDHIIQILFSAFWGMGVGFNLENRHFGKRGVRKAVAYAVDTQAIAKNSGGETKVGVEKLTGIPGTDQGAAEEVLGDYYDQMENYGPGAKPERAAQSMRDAGYSKENGKWVDDGGNAVRFPMKVPAGFSDWVSGTQTIVSQMKQFGFNAEMVTVEGSSFWTQWADSDFVVMAMAWTVGNTNPYLNFDYQLRNSEVKENAGFDVANAQVPPLGEPGGSLQAADIEEKLDTLATMEADASGYQEAVAELAWIENQTLVRMPIQEKLEQCWYTTDEWNVPPADSPKNAVAWPLWWHTRTGDLTAKTE